MSRIFAANSDQISIADSPSINGIASKFTFACWFKANGAQGVFPVLALKDANASYQVFLLSNDSGDMPTAANAVGSFIEASTQTAISIGPNNSFPDGVWTHAAATYDDAGDRLVHLYINGVEVVYQKQQPAIGTLTPDSGGEMLLGNDGFNDNVLGDLAECRLYNTVLTQPQIAAAMNSAVAGTAVAYLHLCGVSDPEPDSSGHGNVGTVTGALAGPDSPVGACSITPPVVISLTTFLSAFSIGADPSTDYLHLKDSTGAVIGWIDSTGLFGGTLAVIGSSSTQLPHPTARVSITGDSVSDYLQFRNASGQAIAWIDSTGIYRQAGGASQPHASVKRVFVQNSTYNLMSLADASGIIGWIDSSGNLGGTL